LGTRAVDWKKSGSRVAAGRSYGEWYRNLKDLAGGRGWNIVKVKGRQEGKRSEKSNAFHSRRDRRKSSEREKSFDKAFKVAEGGGPVGKTGSGTDPDVQKTPPVCQFGMHSKKHGVEGEAEVQYPSEKGLLH